MDGPRIWVLSFVVVRRMCQQDRDILRDTVNKQLERLVMWDLGRLRARYQTFKSLVASHVELGTACSGTEVWTACWQRVSDALRRMFISSIG